VENDAISSPFYGTIFQKNTHFSSKKDSGRSWKKYFASL